MLGLLEMHSVTTSSVFLWLMEKNFNDWFRQLINVHLGEAGLGNGAVEGQSTGRQRQELRARLKCSG